MKPPADGVETGKPLWETRTSSYVPTPLLSGGRIYCVNEDGFAQCLNAADGTLIYSERLTVKKGGRPFYASPTLANSHLYIPSRRSGVYVLKAGDKFEQVELNPPLDDTDFNGSIGVVGNQLFFRSNSHLYCVGAK